MLKWNGCDSCAALAETHNGGLTWSALPPLAVPMGFAHSTPASVTDLYFAGRENGFLFGPGLEVTHDGGQTWQSGSLPEVTEVTGATGYVYAVAESSTGPDATWSLWRSSVGSDSWTPLALPSTAGPLQLSVEGSTLVLLQHGFNGPGVSPTQVGKLWESTDSGSTWVNRPVPCTPPDGGAAVASIALGHPDAWLLDCFDDEQSSQALYTQHHLYGTADAGQTWVRLGDPSQIGDPVSLADNGSGDAVLTTGSGAGDFLTATNDGGVHWGTRFGSGGSFYGWADLHFVSASTGFVVAAENLFRTNDGGRTWQVVPTANPSSSSTVTTPPGNQACSAATLSVHGGRQGGGAVGEAEGTVLLTNTGPAPCALSGDPSVSLLASGGSPLDVAAAPPANPALPPVLLGSMGSATLIVYWSNWCGSPPGPLSIRITLPGDGGTVTGPFNGPPNYDFVPACLGNGPSALTVVHAYYSGGI